MAHTRADFLKGALRFGAFGALAPTMIMDGRLAERALAAGARASSSTVLVVIQLAGGNDGLNMLIPYGDGLYYQNRPTLAIPQSQVLHINNQMGFHPGLKNLKALYDQGKVAAVQGVGYPNPVLSHFRSTDIWQSAKPNGVTDTGWLGRFLDSDLGGVQNPLKAISIGTLLPKAFAAQHTMVPAVQSLKTFTFLAAQRHDGQAQRVIGAFQRVYGAQTTDEGPYLSLVQLAESSAYQATVQLARADAPTSTAPYPSSALATQLRLVSQIIATNLGTRIFHVVQGGYDDHAQEGDAHPRLMSDLGDAIAAFHADLTAQGRADQVLLMTYSEFGRRPLENASNGTDHGTAAPMLIVGGSVKGGLYGEEPSLRDLDYGNLTFTTDFRSVYSTVLSRWLGGDPSAAVMGAFPTIPFV